MADVEVVAEAGASTVLEGVGAVTNVSTDVVGVTSGAPGAAVVGSGAGAAGTAARGRYVSVSVLGLNKTFAERTTSHLLAH